ncbi:hypothetical protein [Pantoea sp. SORGH_AS_0659]|uniref:hypothetical protein n=1 Tax=Pantoea sp. SORGH_AS_0659 TaxID=3062597 RepID=UPI00285638B1|nr:hypothetical protein [Pantoea sp. SORGH_AS_0659]MDR6352594.1 hypothetical protein [Pantoea sp. SORGH_AS_0659]
MQVVERWLLMRLRHEVFHTLAALNLALHGLLRELNTRALRQLPGSHQSQFDTLDKPALKSLSPYRYGYANFR